MKRIRCPKCENFITFDETRYAEGQSLVFICEHCKKQFAIRLGKPRTATAADGKATNGKRNATASEASNGKRDTAADTGTITADDTAAAPTASPYGYITVIENVFGFKQILPLHEGDNIIGRRQPGVPIDVPIQTSDMSMDRRHCILHVGRNRQGILLYTLRDAPSLTGTFYNNELLGDKERLRIGDGAVVTIGATTFILHTPESDTTD